MSNQEPQYTPGQAPPPQGLWGPPMQPTGYAPAVKTNTLAVVSLISAFFIPLVAIITGHVALSQIKGSYPREGGEGMAKAGTILGYVFTAIQVLVIIIVVAAVSSTSTTP